MYGQPLAILVRMLAVLFLVMGTYNPSGYSYWHWVVDGPSGYWVAKLFVLFVIVSGYLVSGYATIRSLGFYLGIPFTAVILTLGWLAWDWGLIDMNDWFQRTLAIEAGIVMLLGIGTSFSIIRYRLAGQMDSRTLAY